MSRTAMWENIGVKASDPHNFDRLLEEANLDYEVEVRPLYIKDENSNSLQVPNRLATVRTDTDDVLGIVTDRYKVCQNRDALDFVKFIEGVELIKAGVYDGGSGCYLIGKLPEVTVLGDVIRPNIIWQNSHDGSSSIKSTICMLRMVCQNQFIRAFSESPATIRLSHMGNLDEKLEVARGQMNSVFDYIQSYQEEANELATKKVTPKMLNSIIQHMFDINEENSDRKNQRLEIERDTFLAAYSNDDNQNFTGTKWGLVNAYSDYITHAEPSRKSENWEEGRFLWYLNPQVMTTFVEYLKKV